MADKLAGVLASATRVLTRAVELDTAGRYPDAVVCYQEGLQLLIDVLKGTPTEKKEGIRTKINEYMKRAEELKKKVEEEKEAGKYHEQIHIESNSTGHSFERLFGRFLDENLTEVTVEDPYIRSTHQLYNFLRFCELLVKSEAKVNKIKLITGQDENGDQRRFQQSKLSELTTSLLSYQIALEIEFSQTLHDREIRFNNGWIIKIGRGLDIYKATQGKFDIGFCDFDLRKCYETTVDIFHSKHVNSTFSASGS
ncbi:MIT domain-containing protein 1-like [Ruditapes philippinarum]|uniref:MIT domain-containing protein 1-like n=1 Tax=Ruditapes philippinarum TaxID=129788 RepID=UPI00295AFA9A|nr:MIT domain-containing protein 1-like [Ruditapes philippinarum]